MIDVEASVRDLIDGGRDCSQSAHSLIGLRKDMRRLIGEWRAAGGGDLLPNLRQRMRIGTSKKDITRAGVPARR